MTPTNNVAMPSLLQCLQVTHSVLCSVKSPTPFDDLSELPLSSFSYFIYGESATASYLGHAFGHAPQVSDALIVRQNSDHEIDTFNELFID